jgi:hypothetical protein
MIYHRRLSMSRRMFVQSGLAAAIATPLIAALRQEQLEEAADVLTRATAGGQVAAAVLHVTQRETTFTRTFGKAQSEQAMFLAKEEGRGSSAWHVWSPDDRVPFISRTGDAREPHLRSRYGRFVSWRVASGNASPRSVTRSCRWSR